MKNIEIESFGSAGLSVVSSFAAVKPSKLEVMGIALLKAGWVGIFVQHHQFDGDLVSLVLNGDNDYRTHDIRADMQVLQEVYGVQIYRGLLSLTKGDGSIFHLERFYLADVDAVAKMIDLVNQCQFSRGACGISYDGMKRLIEQFPSVPEWE
ncbi:hypothetical protein KUW04_16445 [Halomonas denitrificans]|nr:hypothetical protein [Halomonas denitrificans]